VRGLSRRTVLRGLLGAAGGTLAAAWTGGRRAQAASDSSRVIVLTDGRIWTGAGWGDADLDAGALRLALSHALVELTGQAEFSAALAALFPALGDPGQRYGIKVNCVNADLPTHPKVAAALAGLLVDAGARPENVVAFDRSDRELEKCGYQLGTGEHFSALGCDHDEIGYDDSWLELSDGAVRLSRLVTDRIDHLVSMPVLKNHQMAGVTLSLKNHFGSVDDPSRLHGRANDCSPGIAELNADSRLRDRLRLVAIDATFATYESGLGSLPDCAPMALVVATDPVAADIVGQAVINERRQRDGLDLIDARHLHDAAGLGLGVADLAAIERVDIVLHAVEDKPKPWAGEGGCSTSAPAALAPVAAAVGAAAAIGRRARRGPQSRSG